MCGIAGLLAASGQRADELQRVITCMAESLAHRGPDAQATWLDSDAGVGLAHRRLSIIDLSPAGAQPMCSADGRFVIAYNGEIYNFRVLAQRLRTLGVVFRGHSDTEVIVEACAQWGVEATLRELVGIFAIAVWDRRTRTLVLARDHVGVKPLYWMRRPDGAVAFGSELKALRAVGGWHPAVDVASLATYLTYNYVPAPATIYEGVHKLPPGCALQVRCGEEPSLLRFWDARDTFTGTADATRMEPDAWVNELDELLARVIPEQMVADVPVGIFLSGGVDSSTIAALAQARAAAPVRTFAIGFGGTEKDEASYAKAVAAHLGTVHEQLHVDGDAALDAIPRMPDIYDEPLADFAQLPTLLLSTLTRRHVTVALSGDGGDELFGGYPWHNYRLGLSAWCANAPPARRRALSAALRAGSRLFDSTGQTRRRTQVDRLSSFLDDQAVDPVMHTIATKWPSMSVPVRGARPRPTIHHEFAARANESISARRQLLDLVQYLPDDLLTKVDRASMAVGLETRVPLLDQRVVAFAGRVPQEMKIRQGSAKWLLKQVLFRYVPKPLVDRPKMGFVPPMDDWLRGPCRDWAEDLLSETRLREQGLLDAGPIRKRWKEHLSGRVSWSHSLWGVLMFQGWYDRWMHG